MNVAVLYLLLLKATVTSFSGFGSVPLIRDDLVVHRAVLTDEQLNNAIAISQASPGPLGIYVAIVGYAVAGLPGAVVGTLALATPALLAVPIFRAVQRGQATEIRAGSTGVVIVSCVLMMTSAFRLAPQAIPSPAFAILAAAGFVMLAVTRLPPIAVIAVSAALGLVLR
jgi:chromate transporter